MAIERDDRDLDVKRETDLRNAGVEPVDVRRAGDVDRDVDRDVKKAHPDRNPDPITGAPGSHPVGTGIGAAAAGAAGAAIGSVAGPIGTAVGAVVGAVAGGLAGKGVAEAVDPTEEDTYWRDNYATRPYVKRDAAYDEYRPAYRYGWESRSKYAGQSFDEAEPSLSRDWDTYRGQSCPLSWDQARDATRDAWDRCDMRYGAARSDVSDVNQARPGSDTVL